jgi:hypothetical protein
MTTVRNLACLALAGVMVWHSCTTPHDTHSIYHPSKHTWKVKK